MKKTLNKLFIDNDIQIDEDVFDYGYKILKTYLMFIIITLPLSVIFDVVVESILFVIFYTPLKKYIGGFHFNSPKLCSIFSIITTLLMALIIKYYRFDNFTIILFIMISLIIVSFFVGTADHPNKRLSQHEKKTFTKYALIVESLYLLFLLINQVTKFEIFTNVILFSMAFSVGGVLLANLMDKYF